MSVNPEQAIPDVAPVASEPLAVPDGAALPQPVVSAPEEAPPVQAAVRALIMSSDASTIIGKGGQHISELRNESGARLVISPSVPSTQERILTVSGPLDNVSRAFGLLVRRINDEPFLQPSLPGSSPYTVKLLIPNVRMGSVIGKGGSKIKEIQDASGARLQAGETMLPGSTERLLTVSGVADAVHIAVYYVGVILAEGQERGNAGNVQYRPGASASVAAYGAPAYFPAAAPGAAPGVPFVGGAAAPGGAPLGMNPNHPPPGSQTQQIYIPDDLVGSIIGKGGSKINEIRQTSGTHIKIMDPGNAAGTAPSERLVSITGPLPAIHIAVNMLRQRVDEERARLQNAQVLN